MENTIISRWPKLPLAVCLLLSVWLLLPDMAYAGGAGGGNMPWNAPVTALSTGLISLGFALIIIGVFCLGAMFIFGHEWGRLANGLVGAVVAGSLMVGGSALAQALGIAGAVV